MIRGKVLQQIVLGAILADFAVLYLGAVKFNQPAVTIAGLLIMALAAGAALVSF
ncbi:hypothetical protein LVJ94_43800 [Pendulispora rubella]|uniref:Uncharacterized protein n=1 Tax=Pendulispora rubella TaxID=2741070 RepID=A0ABZ2KYR3_9BACT